MATYFDTDIMMKISQCNELYEDSQNSKRNERESKLKEKLFKALNFIICWRSNNIKQKIFSSEEKLAIIKSEEQVINQKLFKIYVTKSQKMQLEREQS